MTKNGPGHVLVVSKDKEMRESLVMTLETAGGYQTSQATNFEEALDKLLISPFSLALVEVHLTGLSGIDLLTASRVLRNQVPVILIDDDLSAKSAVAAFRLGAVDYICKPINLEFILMRIDRELKLTQAPPAPPPVPSLTKHYTSQDRERRLNPGTRSAGLVMKRNQFKQISAELNALQSKVGAKFVGLVDIDENLLGAAGTLENCDLMLLKKALTSDTTRAKPLLGVLGEQAFHSTHFEGDKTSVFIIEFGQPHTVSLLVICPVTIKPGAVWLYSKQAATVIDQIFKTESKRIEIILADSSKTT